MHASYRHLALSEVKPGMVLSDELLDKQGQVLLPKGAVLTDRTIALMPSHGIDMLAVLDPDTPPPAALQDPVRIEARIAHLFRKQDFAADHDRATALLRQFITDYRLAPDAP